MMVDDDDEKLSSPAAGSGTRVAFADIVNTVLYIIRGVELNQPRLLQRAVRQNASVRRFITAAQLQQLVKKYIPADHVMFTVMVDYISKLPADAAAPAGAAEEQKTAAAGDATAMDVAGDLTPGSPTKRLTAAEVAAAAPPVMVLPEVEVYIFTLIVTTMLRCGQNTEAAYAATALIERIRTFNRRSLDVLSAKAYFYLSLAYERIDRLEAIRPTLLLLYRTSCVRRDEMGQSVLLNLLLRNYLHYNLIEQAHTLSLRAVFPETASNNQFCRYLYYMGRIQAIQLEYSEAFQRLTVASRKIPQGYAHGFARIVNKLIVLVQLLMGDIPERTLFNQPEVRQALLPYFYLTRAVRTGDMIEFDNTMQQYAAAFRADGNLTLVQRLGHNVLKTGLRKISVSYSRISLQDIADKLHLASASAAEYICAKAIRDGVIEAKLDHEQGCLSSHEVLDLYGTEEPQKAFHKRIAFCLDVHNEAVKSMRYPPDELYKQELQRRGGKDKKSGSDDDKKDEKTIEELIKEMEEEADE